MSLRDREGINVKKRMLTVVALVLAAALMSGCAMIKAGYDVYMAKRSGAIEVPVIDDGPIMDDYLPEIEGGMDMDAYMAEEAEYMMVPGMNAALFATASPLYGAGYDEFNTEEYADRRENGFRDVRTSPLSTFSADVDTASYCNLRRMLNDGWSPDEIAAGAVRVEEMLNYFRYDYAAPEGDDRFGVTAQIAPCPWNPAASLLMLGVRAVDAPDRVEDGSNLVFLVDVSGSMGDPNKLELVKQALTMLTGELTDRDTVSICTYSDGEQVLIEGANPAKDSAKLISAIEALQAAGYTDGQRGMEQAYEVAMRYFRPRGNNRVIMCSDGDLNVGITSESELHDYVSQKKETGVYLSVLGFGAGNYKDTKMETLADDGNGNYYYIDSILEARKVLVEELTQTLYAVADDVKFQIEFNPAKVSAWRQVGYENRALADADFADDTKDAGEVGAGTTVTVLYELLPAGAGTEDGGLKYQSPGLTEAAQSDEWLTLSTRYKLPGEQTSKLETRVVGEADVTDAPSGDFNFACAVAEFGMLLGRSEHKGDIDYSDVLDLLKRTELSDDYREELFSLVKIAQRLDRLNG